MEPFRNQTKRPLFDAHGREVSPGQIIGIEVAPPTSELPRQEPETTVPPPAVSPAKGPQNSQAESKGGKAPAK